MKSYEQERAERMYNGACVKLGLVARVHVQFKEHGKRVVRAKGDWHELYPGDSLKIDIVGSGTFTIDNPYTKKEAEKLIADETGSKS